MWWEIGRVVHYQTCPLGGRVSGFSVVPWHRYVFVYLGMSVFTFPIFDHTVWLLCVIAMLACFVGRGHIYIGSWLFNCMRTTATEGEVQVGQPKISSNYMFIMWFSGLRGGVAFALASVSFANNDFPTVCGGLTPEARAERAECAGDVTDSQAMLQVTLIIAGTLRGIQRVAVHTAAAMRSFPLID
jgi:solute carrier family 9 (sodium/hydrogen exchanger), member 8